jgi:hypothetical protein
MSKCGGVRCVGVAATAKGVGGEQGDPQQCCGLTGGGEGNIESSYGGQAADKEWWEE